MELTINKEKIDNSLKVLTGVYFVYYIYSDTNECIYIGSSKNVYKRFKEHKYKLSFSYIKLVSFGSQIDCKTFERIEIFKNKPVLNTFDKNYFRVPQIKNHSFNVSELIKNHNFLKRS